MTGPNRSDTSFSQMLNMSFNVVFQRLQAIEDRLASMPPSMATGQMESNQTLAQVDHQLSIATPPIVNYGVIDLAIPWLNTYRVQLDRAQGTIFAVRASDTNFDILGPRDTSLLEPGTRVIVIRQAYDGQAFIIGSHPTQTETKELNWSDYVTQGSATDLEKEKGYYDLARRLGKARVGDAVIAGRPYDQTTQDWGRVASTGVGIHVDEFQAFVRASEHAGLFCNYFDQHVRVAGVNMDIWSGAGAHTVRIDQGEIVEEQGKAVYPWEACGVYSNDDAAFQSKTEEEVQADPVARLEPQQADQAPFHRIMSYGGYLGQGGRQIVQAPPRNASGVRRMSDEDFPIGVFDTGTSLDGEHWIRSAKSVSIVKRPAIGMPLRYRVPEDTLNGDGSESSEYKFSGAVGEGPEHKIGDLEVENEEDSVFARALGLPDQQAHTFAWKADHPFRYHTGDFRYNNEADTEISKNVDPSKLNFNQLRSKSHLDAPTATRLKVDDRYESDYYQSTSYIHLLEEGGVVIGDGYGSELLMVGGNIYLSCPGSVYFMPGKNIIGWAGDDIAFRAKNSIDISSSDKDVRIKADNNLQMVAGNSGVGSIVLESKAESSVQDYKDKVGEEVVGSGILLKSATAPIAMLGGELYLRSMSENGGTGIVTIDADKGQGNLITESRTFVRYMTQAFDHFGESSDNGFTINKSNCWTEEFATICSTVNVDGTTIFRGTQILQGNLIIDVQKNSQGEGSGGGILVYGGHILTTTAKKGSTQVGPLDEDNQLAETFQSLDESIESIEQNGTRMFERVFTETIYSNPTGLGSEELIKFSGFTYRDDDEGKQYGVQDGFKLPQPRWQRMTETGEATGGQEWTENPVIVNERPMYPFPGRKAMTSEESLLKYSEFKLYDPQTGTAKSEQEAFEDVKLSVLDTAVIDKEFKCV